MIGVDVGETRVRIELFDLTLTELARAERPLTQQRHEVEGIVGPSRDGIAEVLSGAGIGPERLLGVGIGVPGIVEHTPARCRRARPDHRLGRGPAGALLACGLPTLPAPVPYSSTTAPRPSARPRCGSAADAAPATPSSSSSAPASAPVWSPAPEVEHRQAVEWGHPTVTGQGPPLPLRCPRLPGGVRGRRVAAGALAGGGRSGPEGADEETALAAMLAARPPAGGAGRPGGARRAGGDGRVPGRGPLRPDQPLPARSGS